MVVAVDLQLVDGVVLQLGADLPHEVHEQQGQDVGAEDLPYLVRGDGGGLDAVDDEAHHPGVDEDEQGHVGDGGEHGEERRARLHAGDLPKAAQRALDGGLLELLDVALGHARLLVRRCLP